jgi:hypothetical protein
MLGESRRRIAHRQHEVGAPFAQRLPGTGHHLGADAQAGAAVQRLEVADVPDQRDTGSSESCTRRSSDS